MKAVVYDSPRRFTVGDVPTPDPGPGEVRITVHQAGVCGTDVHIHHGDFDAIFPLVSGHKLVGTVEALGEGVHRFTIGEQVPVKPNLACGQCDYCRAGLPIACSDLKGLGTNFPGCFAEYVVVPATLVFSVEGLDPALAVFTEPAACAMHGVETLAPRPGSTALVFGAGPTGLLLAQMLRASGVIRVTVAAPTQFKLDTADRLGIDHTVLIDRDDPQGNQATLLEASGAEGYDYVIEASGSTAVLDICVPLTRSGGTILVYGVAHPEDVARFEPFDVFRREITIKGSFAEITSFDAAIRALRSGRVRTDGIVTHRFPLADCAGAIDAVEHDRSAHKVVLVP